MRQAVETAQSRVHELETARNNQLEEIISTSKRLHELEAAIALKDNIIETLNHTVVDGEKLLQHY